MQQAQHAVAFLSTRQLLGTAKAGDSESIHWQPHQACLELPPSAPLPLALRCQVMDVVELSELRGATIGLPGVSGLSVEQRKRLTIAVREAGAGAQQWAFLVTHGRPTPMPPLR